MTTPFPFVAGQVLTAAQLNDIQNLPISDKTASYTLIAGDETKRTMMNNASATTITVNNSIFTVGDVIQVANKGAGTCTITAGAGVTINTSGSLALAQYGGGYLLALSASTFTFFNLGGGVSYGTATGGTSSSITVSGQNYTLLTFTSDSTLTVTKAGLFDYYIVAGGGSGGVGQSNVSGAGGGAGGVLTGTAYFSANQTIDIGAGGSASTTINASTPGLGSVIGTGTGALSAAGGGQGGGHNAGNSNPGNGGSGGGSTYSDPTTIGKSVVSTIQGYDGGQGSTSLSVGAAGGGGATAVGANQTGASTTGAAGGAGVDVGTFISGSLFKAGGGGGGGATGGAGGSSVGGSGGSGAVGNNASANTGSGGGGAGYGATRIGGNGGSGIIYVRFKV